MTTHSFDTEIAAEVGINAAVVFQHILFWITKNAANGDRGKHFREGKWWTYQSARGMALLFPYMSEHQVRRAVDRLEEAGLIMTGNFNQSSYDRTRWFCVLREIHLALLPDGSRENAKPIPDRNPDSNPDDKNTVGASADLPDGKAGNRTSEAFAAFWEAYPRKVEKQAAARKFAAALKAGIQPERIIAAAARYAQSDQVARGYVKHPTTWLNAGCWDDTDAAPAPAQAAPPAKLDDRRKFMRKVAGL